MAEPKPKHHLTPPDILMARTIEDLQKADFAMVGMVATSETRTAQARAATYRGALLAAKDLLGEALTKGTMSTLAEKEPKEEQP